jgi:uncharacterized protein DUF2784
MIYRALADGILVLHLGFVVFVALGGLLLPRWGGVAYIHIPAAIWGALIEFTGGNCPLTPLEQQFRRLGGEEGYAGGFIEHYFTAALYPAGLTRGMQLALGTLVLVVNLAFYWGWWRSRRSLAHAAGSEERKAHARNRSV